MVGGNARPRCGGRRLVEVVEILEVVPEFCSCFLEARTLDGVSFRSFVEGRDGSAATGEKGSDHGLGSVL